jgi:hypothetical protein
MSGGNNLEADKFWVDGAPTGERWGIVACPDLGPSASPDRPGAARPGLPSAGHPTGVMPTGCRRVRVIGMDRPGTSC